MTTLTGTFHNTAWDEQTLASHGAVKLTRAEIEQAVDGDIVGTATWTSLMCYAPDGTAEYVGMQRIVGRFGGRDGSVVIRTDGTFDGTVAATTWRIVPGSGTGALEGVQGSGRSAAPHGPDGTYTLEIDEG